MVDSHKMLWDKCLGMIKDNVTEQQFKTWFAPIGFESYSVANKTLLVQVPSPYVYEYLEQYYVGLLSKVLTRCFGTNVRLTYRIVTDKAHNISQDVEADEPAEIEQTVAAPQARSNRPQVSSNAASGLRNLNPQLNLRHTFNNYIEGLSLIHISEPTRR